MTTSTFPDVMEKLVSLCKRRGFIFQSSEIYGGTGSVWDYGPLGVELKKNLKDRWWNAMVRARDDIEGLDAAILMHPRVWEASGHVSGFVDPLVDCSNCKKRFRADDPRIKGTPGTPDAQCPACGMKGTLGAARLFNLMFKTFMGPVEDTASRRVSAPGDGAGHLRELPERAAVDAPEDSVRHRADRQGVPQRDHAGEFHLPHARVRADGDAVLRRARQRHGVVRVLEGAAASSGTSRSDSSTTRLQFHQHTKEELAHYARAAFDVQFDFGGTLGFQEIEGVHNRGDFDLTQHQQFSGKKLEYFDQPNNRRYMPYVVETSVGADRTTLAVLVNAYHEETVEGEDGGTNRAQAACRRSRRSRRESFRS